MRSSSVAEQSITVEQSTRDMLSFSMEERKPFFRHKTRGRMKYENKLLYLHGIIVSWDGGVSATCPVHDIYE